MRTTVNGTVSVTAVGFSCVRSAPAVSILNLVWGVQARGFVPSALQRTTISDGIVTMRVIEWFLQLLMLPIYVAIFLIFAAPGLIQGTWDILTAPFVGLHEGLHMRVADLRDVQYTRVNPLVIAFHDEATSKDVLLCNLAPLVLLPFAVVSFYLYSISSHWVSYIALFVAVGLARYSLPSSTDVYSAIGSYSLTFLHLLLLPVVVVLAVLRAPRHVSVLLDYLVEIAWVAFLFVSVEYWGVVWSVVSAL